MLAVATTVFRLAASVSALQSLSVSVSNPSNVDIDSLELTTTISNTGNETLRLLNDPRTPLSRWATNTFSVANDDGVAPDFTGVNVRFLPEVAAKNNTAQYTILAPGESVDVSHEVGRYYNFTNAGEGNFHFKPVNRFTLVSDDGVLSPITADTVPGKILLSGRLASTKALSVSSLGGALHHSVKRSSVESCSSSQQSQVNDAIADSKTLATNALSHLSSNPSGSSLQTTWYGTFDQDRYNLTTTAFTHLQTFPADWTYNCDCSEAGVYAYVYPSQYGTVYLCPYFWQAPATGSGSRADTLIHEGTHFDQVLGTDDKAYGESACKSLAASDPDGAVHNADNHAFFSDYA